MAAAKKPASKPESKPASKPESKPAAKPPTFSVSAPIASSTSAPAAKPATASTPTVYGGMGFAIPVSTNSPAATTTAKPAPTTTSTPGAKPTNVSISKPISTGTASADFASAVGAVTESMAASVPPGTVDAGTDKTGTNQLWVDWSNSSGVTDWVKENTKPSTPTPPNTPAADPNEKPKWLIEFEAEQERIRKQDEAERAAETSRRRNSAFDDMKATLSGYGIDMDGSFSDMLKGWVWEDKSADWMMMEIRKSAPYNKRFTGMADLIKRGQFMDEATYIAQERSYFNTMKSWGLPKNFYDDPSDYGRLISNGVSVKELDDRIASAKTFLDSTDSNYRNSLRDLYGIDESGMLAYVLDGDKAQAVLQQQFKAAAMSGAGRGYDFNMSKDQAQRYAGTLGDEYNRMGADQVNALRSTMAGLDEVADNQQSLAAIDNEAYNRTDTLDAELLKDTNKQAASQRRALREKARFDGSSAFVTGSMARNTGV